MDNRAFQPQEYIFVDPAVLHGCAARYKSEGWRYINTNATVPKGSDQILLTVMFAKGPKVDCLHTMVREGEHISSISDLFFSAFVFENETHDLFGIIFDGLTVDFHGTFYKMAVDMPMRPHHVPATSSAPAHPARTMAKKG